ncbi:unnamed protein product [Linum trigynum]|uniref:Uncharacterized protein n=1 Tax=Linum trigynum TaxID=586398 RepID=A0AAV2FJU8_9ROSI
MAAISWADGVNNRPDPRPHPRATAAARSARDGSTYAALPPSASAAAATASSAAGFAEEDPPPPRPRLPPRLGSGMVPRWWIRRQPRRHR